MPRLSVLLLCVLRILLVYGLEDYLDYDLLVENANTNQRNSLEILSATPNEFTVGKMRKARFIGEECSCGPSTSFCMLYKDAGKLCSCDHGDRYVLGGECEDCHCKNGLCFIQNGTCECMEGYAMKGEECTECKCGTNYKTCSFLRDIQFCMCGDYFALNAPCEECICGRNQYCYYKGITMECNCTSGRCKDCECTEDSDTCSFVENTKICKCLPDYAMLNGSCAECKCGENYKCEFLEGEKHCSCEEGFTENNGNCEECDCGSGHECTFHGTQKYCICKENSIFHNGTCKDCPCGDGYTCEIIEDELTCVCGHNYIEENGSCVECFCGEGHSCEIIKGEKVCICEENYYDNNGICEECYCGADHSCEFRNGRKFCKCLQHYADNNGTCEECYCGESSTCLFENGEKVCICKDGFSQNNGKCHATCQENSNCSNNGSCKSVGLSSFCACRPGTSGDFCSQVDECHIKYKNCKNAFGKCQYNVKFQKAYCECGPQQVYDATVHICKECFCGEGHSCRFVNGQKTCTCAEYFVEVDGICREVCAEITCHQGKCTESGNTTFCSCDAGFTGLRCDRKITVSNGMIYLVSVLSAVTLFWIVFISVCVYRRQRRHKDEFSTIEDDVPVLGTVSYERDTEL